MPSSTSVCTEVSGLFRSFGSVRYSYTGMVHIIVYVDIRRYRRTRLWHTHGVWYAQVGADFHSTLLWSLPRCRLSALHITHNMICLMGVSYMYVPYMLKHRLFMGLTFTQYCKQMVTGCCLDSVKSAGLLHD